MNTVQSTIYGNKLVLAMLLGRLPVVDAHTTQNERLNIQAGAVPVAGDVFRMGILMVGNKGHRATVGNDGIALTSIVDHLADHASLYNPMPMCVRAINDDIPLAKRAKYALRRQFTRAGEQVYEYYGLRVKINVTDAPITMEKRTIEDGVESPPVPFVPTSANLYPTAPNLPSSGAVSTSDVRLTASTLLSVTLTEEDIEEYVNSVKWLYNGDERYAVISEMALCTGVDRKITVPTTSGQTDFLESIATQIYSFSADHKAVYYNSQELKLDFDVGNQVPLLGTESIPTLETIGARVDNSTAVTSKL